LATKRFIKLFVDVNQSISEQNKDIQAKKNTPKPISINVFQEFQAIIKRILEQTKKPQATACGWCTIFLVSYRFLVRSLRKQFVNSILHGLCVITSAR